MTRLATLILSAALGLSGAFAPLQAAVAADLSKVSTDHDGACSQPWVLRAITSRFRHQVQNVPHLPNVQITDFQRIHQHRYEPVDEYHQIERRYCGATVALSDGRDRDIWYLIEGRMGFAGVGENVEFCVAGFDRWLVYNGHCRVLQ